MELFLFFKNLFADRPQWWTQSAASEQPCVQLIVGPFSSEFHPTFTYLALAHLWQILRLCTIAIVDLIESSKQRAVSNMEVFFRNFSHVPDDRLTWTPTPNAKSAIRIAAHTALYAGRFARMIRDRRLPAPENLTEWLAERDAEEIAITSRAEMEKVFRAGTAEVLEALDTLTPDEVEGSLDSGQGWTMPMKQLMGLPGWHATLHLGQIDYLQTCWDDQEVYLA